MPTSHTLTGDLSDLVGTGFPRDSVWVTIRTNLGDDADVRDATGKKLRLPYHRFALPADGTFSKDLWSTAALTNPTAYQYQVEVEYPTGRGGTARQRWISGWFSHTADQDLSELAYDPLVPPVYYPELLGARDEAVAAKDDAEAAQAAAEAAQAAAEGVGNTNDTIIASRINDPASATASALTASIDEARFAELHDDFTTKAAGTVTTADSGQTWVNDDNAQPGANMRVVTAAAANGDALLTYVPTGTSAAAGYTEWGPFGDPITHFVAEYEWLSLGPEIGGVAIVALEASIVGRPPVPDSPCHLVLKSNGGWDFGIFEGGTNTVVKTGTLLSAPVVGTRYRVEVTLDRLAATAYVRLPDGSIITVSDARIGTMDPRHFFVECYANTLASTSAIGGFSRAAASDRPLRVTEEVATPALLLRDQAPRPGDGPRSTWTPALTGTGWALGNATVRGRWGRRGNEIWFDLWITWGSTSTFGSAAPALSLPVSAHLDTRPVGDIWMTDVSAGQAYMGQIMIAGSTFSIYRVSTTGQGHLSLSGFDAAPFALASGDQWRITGNYEAAA